MTQSNTQKEAIASYFIQPHSVMIRIWHWLTFFLITGAIITVAVNSFLMNPRENIALVQEQLKSRGATVTEEQAFAVSHEYEDKIWGIHKWIGYGLAILLLSRIVIELAQPGEEKLRFRIKHALGFYRKKEGDTPEYKHYLTVKTGYLAFYILLACMAFTGLCMAFGRQLGIPRELYGTIKEIHSFGQYCMYAFVLVHLCGVIVAENRKSAGIVSGMINGN
jgi:Ni/Fe-hydrogenase 1 B-type cytochrome subunit